MKNYITPVSVVILILINNYIDYRGHFSAPISILFTPVLLAISALLLLYYTDYSLKLKYACITLVVIVNDMLLRLSLGGYNDPEGEGWITLFLFTGLLLLLPILIIYSLKKKVSAQQTSVYMVICVLVLYVYLSYFNTLGTRAPESPIKSKAIAKQKGLYISDLTFSDSSFIAGKDTFYIKDGWLQNKIWLSHSSILKKMEKDKDDNYCTIELKGRFDKDGYNYNASYNAFYDAFSKKYAEKYSLSNNICFLVSRTCNTIEMTVFSAKDSGRIVKIIKVKPKSL